MSTGAAQPLSLEGRQRCLTHSRGCHVQESESTWIARITHILYYLLLICVAQVGLELGILQLAHNPWSSHLLNSSVYM